MWSETTIEEIDIMKMRIMISALIALCLCGCSNGAWIEDIIVPTQCVYYVQIVSNYADDVDINLMVGDGINVAGSGNTLVCETGSGVCFVNGDKVYAVTDDVFNELYVGNSVVDLCYDMMSSYSVDSVSREVVEEFENEYYLFKHKVRDDKFGDAEVSVYANKETNELHKVVIVLSSGITVMLSVDDNYNVGKYNPMEDYSMSGEEALNCLSKEFIENNVYTFGKYEFVNEVIERYNNWLGGTL